MTENGSSMAEIPPEVWSFLAGSGGHSLIVKGGAGTGKTTFCLELLEKAAKTGPSFYLSTRVSDEALYRQFNWLKTTEMRSRIFDSGKILLDMLVGKEPAPEPAELSPDQKARVSGAKDFLKSIGEKKDRPTKVDRTRLSTLTETTRMPEVEHVYDRIERILPEKSLVLIDSLEGITHRYGLEMEEFVMCLQKDLVENSNTNVALVLEKSEAGGIEYLVDGLVTLSREDLDERRIRHVRLDKLRATTISSPRYVATLMNGRFRALGTPLRLDHGQAPGVQSWKPYPDTVRHFSTGIPSFDAILGGGYVKGSYNAFDIDVNVSIDDYYLLFVPTILNFLTQGRGLMGILAGGEYPAHLRSSVVAHIPPAMFDNRVRIIDYTATETTASYVLPMGRVRDRSDAQKALEKLERIVSGGPEKTPYIEYTAFDTLEYQLGDQPTITGLFPSVQRTKILGTLGIGVLKPGLVVGTEIINMMDTYFHIICIDNCPCIYGVRPRTPVYAIDIDQQKGKPHVCLTPIV
jgi:KaiC/GvpD/RAD55 family RecA-like ATPase